LAEYEAALAGASVTLNMAPEVQGLEGVYDMWCGRYEDAIKQPGIGVEDN
jgi:hypothetical protein